MGLPHRSASLLWGSPTDLDLCYGLLLWDCPIDLDLCYGAAPQIWASYGAAPQIWGCPTDMGHGCYGCMAIKRLCMESNPFRTPKCGTPKWDPKVGPPNVGPQNGTPKWDPQMGPQNGTPKWDPKIWDPQNETLKWDPKM